jgi:hypothetical protein
VLGDMFWEGQLDEDAVDGGVVVVLVDTLEELGFGDVFREVDEFAINVGLVDPLV